MSTVLSRATKPDYAGWVKKKGAKIKKYRKRWFELRGVQLLYFKTKTSRKPAGIITMNQSCKAEIDENRKYSIRIKGIGLSRVYELSMDSDEERDGWINAINKNCSSNSSQDKKDRLQNMDSDEEEEDDLSKAETIFSSSDPKDKVTIDDFDLLSVIGRGSFGKVMLVRKKTSQQVYAMKILRKDMIIKENMVSHTNAEKNILQQIDHPFIVGLKYAFQTAEKLYMVLDFLAGGELFYHLKEETKFPIERAKFYCAEIVCAIEHLHKHDIIYRDLKPENVVLDRQGHVVLTDFGLAKTCISNATPTYTFCGTPEYLAPEILKGQGHAKAVDWWSLGILLYEMIVGLPPFYSENINEMYELILKAPLKFPSFVPVEAQQLLRGLLEREEFKRLGSGPKDAQEIKGHPFFKDINWKKLVARKITPPFVPKLDDKTLAKYFDKEFTDERVIDSFAEVYEDTEDSFDSFDFSMDAKRKKAKGFLSFS